MNKNAELPPHFTARHGTDDDIPAAVELFNRFSQHYLGVREVEVDRKSTRLNSSHYS